MVNSFSKKEENKVIEPIKNWKRRKVFNLSRSKLPIVIITLLMLYVCFSLGLRFDQLYAMQRDVESIQTEIKDLKIKNDGLQKQLKIMQSDVAVEQVAREKLGLVKKGEAKIVPEH